ncbi:MAG: formimidoylglutamase, partial [Flavobacteriaceae bacterium]|nr:arginase family protein [Eudoraea sp.]NNJ38418.1 formimidoylglutamase [Flavobacteriaceae bacterium]
MYKAPSHAIWKGRSNASERNTDLRWYQAIHLVDLLSTALPKLKKQQKGIVLLGFRCDEGVRRNQGRTGAFDGPVAIRKSCANFAWHVEESSFILVDGGNVECHDGMLEEAQDELAALVTKVMKHGYFPLVLGGGHEVAFGSYKGAFHFQQQKIPDMGVINFDAHFDLREYKDGANSGTPFLQIADLCSSHHARFNYLCLGIQPQSNTRTLFKKAEELNVDFLLGEDLV